MSMKHDDIEVCPECGTDTKMQRTHGCPDVHWSNPIWIACECNSCGCKWEVTFEPSRKIIRKRAAKPEQEEE